MEKNVKIVKNINYFIAYCFKYLGYSSFCKLIRYSLKMEKFERSFTKFDKETSLFLVYEQFIISNWDFCPYAISNFTKTIQTESTAT